MASSDDTHWETLAEFDVELIDKDEIYCLCSRVSISDTDLLQMDESTKYSNDFIRGLNKMRHLGVDVSFQNTFPSEADEDDLDDEEDYIDNSALYDQPVVDYDPEFSDDIEVMEIELL